MLLAVQISRPVSTNLPHMSCRATTGWRGQDFDTAVAMEGVAVRTQVSRSFPSSDNWEFISSTENIPESKKSKNRRKSVFLVDIFS